MSQSTIQPGPLVTVVLTLEELTQIRVSLLSRQAQLALDSASTESPLMERHFRIVTGLIGKLFGPRNVNAQQNEVTK